MSSFIVVIVRLKTISSDSFQVKLHEHLPKIEIQTNTARSHGMNSNLNYKGKTNTSFMATFLKDHEITLENQIIQAVNSQSPRCRPDCTNRTNRIILTDQGMAGLNDRESVLYHVGNIATYFCASITVDKPCKLLNFKKHGQGKSVSCDLEWSDFRKFERYHGSCFRSGNDDLILNTIKSKYYQKSALNPKKSF